MPWKPSFEGSRPDPRLDPYRGRVARLEIHGETAGYILVETEFAAHQISGHLWWRKWGEPKEFARVDTMLTDGTYDDSWLIGEDLDAELEDWAAGQSLFEGSTYALTWLDGEESEQVHREVFAHNHS